MTPSHLFLWALRPVHNLVSLIEELEAVDWYNQRVDASTDKGLKAILAHNRDEEKEHAAPGSADFWSESFTLLENSATGAPVVSADFRHQDARP